MSFGYFYMTSLVVLFGRFVEVFEVNSDSGPVVANLWFFEQICDQKITNP